MRAIALIGLTLVLASGAAAPAATPPPGAINVEKLEPKSLLPKRPLHTEFVVEVNKYGQVARVRSGKSCPDPAFNAQTYGNALQAFIRTPDGKAIPGVYRLTYDFNPKTERVRRDVALLRVGGVNANAIGAATQMMQIARKNRNRPPPGVQRAPHPQPLPSVDVRRMPDLPQVMKSPAH